MKLVPPFDKALLDWYQESTFRLRSNAHDIEPLLEEEYEKLKQPDNKISGLRAMVYQSQHNHSLYMAHLCEEMRLVMMMVNVLSIAYSDLPDKKEYKKGKADMAHHLAALKAELAKHSKIARVQNDLWNVEINEADKKP
jgi:CRISPR/Cas system-associated endoribonuclease Cas2